MCIIIILLVDFKNIKNCSLVLTERIWFASKFRSNHKASFSSLSNEFLQCVSLILEEAQLVLPVRYVLLDGINQMKPTSGVSHVEPAQPPYQRVQQMRMNAVSLYYLKRTCERFTFVFFIHIEQCKYSKFKLSVEFDRTTSW